MPHRYLFGPVTAEYAEQHLGGPRRAGECLAFNDAGTTDLTIGLTDSWDAVQARFPAGWKPDFVVLDLDYTSIPGCLWTCPLPLVGLAPDWNLLWHGYRASLRRCDWVVTDHPGVEVLTREGISQVQPGNLFGCGRALVEGPWPEGPRDLDILFVGNVHPAVHRERLAWLPRLARLGERWKVAIHTGIYGAGYRALLARARIVFNRSIRGECNQRVFEAAAAGALLFQEAGNRETESYFRDRRECVSYTGENLEGLLEHYLTHEQERRAITEAARSLIPHYRFEDFWKEILERLQKEWPTIQQRARQRPVLPEEQRLQAHCWRALSSTQLDPTLVPALKEGLSRRPRSAVLHNTLGLAVALEGSHRGRIPAAEALGHFRRAVECDPCHVLAHYNAAEALMLAGQVHQAVEQARHTLTLVDRLSPRDFPTLNQGLFPPAFSLLRVEWERAAWDNPGRPTAEVEAKTTLLRWALHALLTRLTGDLYHLYEACLLRPDLPTSRAALGQSLVAAGRPAQALPHLRAALAAHPFNRETARALHSALKSGGDHPGQRRLALERRLLAQAAPQLVPLEPWFAEQNAVPDELVSLVIPCCNQLSLTQLCLESVLRHTATPYELILIDNGSEDATAAYFREVAGRPGPRRIELIRNERNRGFAAACNQGLERSQGRYLLFLNNDTVVTPGWLEGLLGCLRRHGETGLVGPATNRATPPHQVPADYKDLSDLDAFAARRRQEFTGQSLTTRRLSAFCLLARREVFERIGPFDEQFGLGLFDDDDLCLRATKAGYGLRVALDVFLHHFGARTFAALGIDCVRQLHKNFQLFRAKWGAEEVAMYRLPPPPPDLAGWDTQELSEPAAGVQAEPEPSSPRLAPVGELSLPSRPAPAGARPRGVSLCMIVRNEEANLAACLCSVQDLVAEMVIVDTGSTDRTRDIARSFGAKTVDFPWVDSFAAARNESIRHVSSDWIFWMDADDRVDEGNRQRLRLLFSNLTAENIAYVMKVQSGGFSNAGAARMVDHVRLFRNHPQIRWSYRVHEQILQSVCRQGGRERWTDVVIHHVGYEDPAHCERKHKRNLHLLELDLKDNPADPFTLFNLGWTHQALGQYAQALPLLQRNLELGKTRYSFIRKLYALLVTNHRRLHQLAEALSVCRRGLAQYPDDSELLYQQGLLLYEQGDHVGAEGTLQRLLQTRPSRYFEIGVDSGLRGYLTRYNLGVIFRDQGKVLEAEKEWRAVLVERPDYTPASLGLAELWLAQGRWDEVERSARQLEIEGQRAIDAMLLRARLHMARQEFSPARELLERGIQQAPRAVWPRLLLSHALLQEGRDWTAAEQALREVLTLDPNNSQARKNLHQLLQRQGSPQDRTAP